MPSKPKSFSSLNLSMMDWSPRTMSRLTPLRSLGFLAGAESSAAGRAGNASAAIASVPPVCFRKSRRLRKVAMLDLLNKFGSAGHRYRWHGEGHVPGEFLGHQAFLGVHRLLPGDRLPRVRGHAAGDGEQGALSHPDTVVDRLAVANGREEFVVLRLVHVVFRAVIFPGLFADNLMPVARAIHDAFAFGSGDVLRFIVVATGLLAAIVETARSVFILINNGEVVVDIAQRGPHLAAAVAGYPRGWRVAHRPGHHVEAVDRLLDDMVAGEPTELIPVAQLHLQVGPIGFANGHIFDRRGVIRGINRGEFTDGAIEDLAERGAFRIVRPPAESGGEAEILLL